MSFEYVPFGLCNSHRTAGVRAETFHEFLSLSPAQFRCVLLCETLFARPPYKSRYWNEGGVHGRAAGYQRSTGPPEMESRNVALANRLFAGSLSANLLNW